MGSGRKVLSRRSCVCHECHLPDRNPHSNGDLHAKFRKLTRPYAYGRAHTREVKARSLAPSKAVVPNEQAGRRWI